MAGPDPTFSSCWSQLGLLVKIIDELETHGTAYEDLEDALTTALDGVFTPSALGLVRQYVRAGLAQGLAPDALQEMFRPFFQEMLRAINSHVLTAQGALSDAEMMAAVRLYMVANAETLNSREMTFDTAGAGATTGTGAVYRVTVDQDGKTLECTGAEDKVLVCVADQNSPGGQKHSEQFELRFSAPNPDGLQWVGTGGTRTLTSLHARSGGILVNSSFEQGAVADDTALEDVDQITGWEVATAANWKTSTDIYRGWAGDQGVTHYSLECVASDSITQIVKKQNAGASFRDGVPYRCQVAVKRVADATGTVTLHLGAVSKSVDLSTLTTGQWAILAIDLNQNAYFKAFNKNDLDVKIVVASLAVGTVRIDDLVLAEMTPVDGTFWCVVGGATPWKEGDQLTFDGDAEGATRAILSYWLWRAYVAPDPRFVIEMGGWFPTADDGSETIADPA